MNYLKNAIKDSYVLVDNGNNEQDMMHIALASDANYAKYVGVSVYSVVKNNPNRAVHFHLFFDNVFEEDSQKIKDIILKDSENKGGGIKLAFI